MERIVEIYPDAESAKLQAAARKKFGWKTDVKVNDRGAWELTLTRDNTTAKGEKLRALEEDFAHCSAASDYIERFMGVFADKKRFRAFSAITLIILIYCIIQLGTLALVSCMLKLIYTMDPAFIYDLGLTVVVGDAAEALTADWQYAINLKEIGLSGIAAIFGFTEEILTLTVDFLIDMLFSVGIASGVGVILILFFMIRKAVVAKSFYMAEVAYIKRRKELLQSKLPELDRRMDAIMREAKPVSTAK